MIPVRGRLFGRLVTFLGVEAWKLEFEKPCQSHQGGEWHQFPIESVWAWISAMEDSDAFQHLSSVCPVCATPS